MDIRYTARALFRRCSVYCLLINLFLLAGLQAANAAEQLTVREFAGAVKLKIDDRWKDPRVGMVVALPATVSTGADGSIELVQGETVYSVTANTALNLFAAADGQLVKRVVQSKGSAFYDVSDRKQRNFRVETPYLVAVIKGTQFNVTVEAEMASVALFEGLLHIEVPDTGEVIELQAGFIARRHKGDTGITVIRMDDGEPVAATRIKPPSNPGDDDSNDTAAPGGSGQHGDAVADNGTTGGDIAIDPNYGDTQLDLSAGTDLDAFDDEFVFAADFDPELDADIAAGVADLGTDVAFGGGDLSGDLGVGLDDFGAGDLNAALAPGVAADLTGDLSADLGADIGAGDLDVGVDADLTGGDLSADLGAEIGAGDLDVGLGAGVDADLSGGDLSADLGADVGAGDLDVDLDAGVDAGLAGGGLSADLGADVGAGDLDAGLDAGVDADLADGGLSADLGADVGVGGLDTGVDAGVDANLADGDVGLDVGVGNLGLDVGLDGGGLDLGLDLNGDDPSGDTQEDEEEDSVPLIPELGNLLGF